MNADRKRAFDVVVVGAGAAGCALTRRLLDAGAEVALLEAGPADHPALADPARALELPFSEVDWRYATIPQRFAGDRVVPIAAGRVLGGGTAINNTIYARGSREDFDAWARAGNPGWSYDEVAEAFAAIEDLDHESPGRGVGGPLRVTSRYERHPLMEAYVEAAAKAGLPRRDDYNLGDLEGTSFLQFTSRDGERRSAFTSFLAPVLSDPRLTVLTDCTAHELLFDGGRCSGVRVELDGEVVALEAGERVVASAGAIGTPKLLMASGIGPADHLEELEIPVRVDLPEVGANLQDHALLIVTSAASRPVPAAAPRAVQYQATSFAKSDSARSGVDLQFEAVHLPMVLDGEPPEFGFTLLCVLSQPQSRGTVRLASREPDAPALVDLGLLSAAADRDALVAGVEWCRRIESQAPLDGWLQKELTPGAEVVGPALADWVTDNSLSFYHPVGSCRMGSDEGAVVDGRLRVRGVEALHVADASIMPTITSANTQGPSMMIGYRAAEVIVGGPG